DISCTDLEHHNDEHDNDVDGGANNVKYDSDISCTDLEHHNDEHDHDVDGGADNDDFVNDFVNNKFIVVN
ncbi:MAG: hypothetical protein ACKO8V_00465, partial [Actinomycetota bacterium]